MTNPKKPEQDPRAPLGVNDDAPADVDDRPQHEDEVLGDLLGNRDPESSSRKQDKPAK